MNFVRKNNFHMIFILSALILIVFVVFFFYYTKRQATTINNLSQVKIEGTVLSVARPLRSFRLTDDQGKAFANKNLRGHWTMLFFGFTRCHTVCPTTMAELNKFYLDLYKRIPEKLLPQIVLVSLDPKYDTEKRLNAYVKSFNHRFIGLRGSSTEVASLAKQMHVSFQKVPLSNGRYTIIHSKSVLLITPRGKLLAYFTYPPKASMLVKDYKKVIETYRKLYQ